MATYSTVVAMLGFRQAGALVEGKLERMEYRGGVKRRIASQPVPMFLDAALSGLLPGMDRSSLGVAAARPHNKECLGAAMILQSQHLHPLAP